MGLMGLIRRRRVQPNDGGSGNSDSRIINGNDSKGGDDKVLCSIPLMFCKLVEGGYVQMVWPIVTNCKLDDMLKGEKCTYNWIQVWDGRGW